MICSNCKANCSDDSLYCGKCGQSLIGSDMQITRNDFTHELKNNRSLNFKSGENFGERYRIISELGKGGMGQVFKAHDNVLDIDVALKMIRPEFLMNKKMISRFKQEILLAREITHENVSRIYDFGDVDGIKFISMEFISGRTLKDIVRKDGPIEVEKAIKISKAICNGLSAAHKKEIIHRDLKPQNIMIDENDHVFITDFGLAKSVREENVSHTGLVIGTPQYIPPELWKGEIADKRSDIYSLGIIMYEMVAGEELFQSDSDYGYLQKHVNEEPVFPQNIKDKLPSFYKNLILKCLFKDRANRYQDCSDVHRDLKDRMYSTGKFISELERSIKKTGFKKLGLAVLFILLISFFGSLILKKGTPPQKKRSVAILYFKNLSGIKGLDHFSYSLPELLTTDLGQSKYIKVLPEDKVSKILKESNYLSSAFIDEKMFEALGEQAKVNYLVQGSFIKSGNDLRITLKLRDSDTGEMLSTDYVDATVNNIFPAVDKLTTGLKRRFNLTDQEILADIDNNIEEITTSSTEALKYYVSGKKFFNNSDYEGSIVEFQKAISIDSEFAMAYRGIAYAYSYLNDMKNRKKYFNKTIEHIEKMSEKEKMLIYADLYGEEFITFDKSLEYYNKLLSIYPDDINANLETGFFYMWFEDWDKAINRLRNVLQNDAENILALKYLVQSYLGKGDSDTAEKLLNEFEKLFPDKNKSQILKLKYRVLIINKKYDLAMKAVQELRSKYKLSEQAFFYYKIKADLLKNNTIDSTKEYNKLLEYGKGLIKYSQVDNLEFMFLYNGLFRKSFDIIKNQIEDLNYGGYIRDLYLTTFFIKLRTTSRPESLLVLDSFKTIPELKHSKGMNYPDLFLKGYANINLGNIAIAEEITENIGRIRNSTLFKKQVSRLYFILKSLIEKTKKNYKRAIKYLDDSLKYVSAEWGANDESIANSALIYFELGHLNFVTKQFEESEKWFKKIGELTHSRYFFGDLYAKSLYYLGKIYMQKKWIGKAIESYSKFIDLWANGDMEVVSGLILDAKSQIEILKN